MTDLPEVREYHEQHKRWVHVRSNGLITFNGDPCAMVREADAAIDALEKALAQAKAESDDIDYRYRESLSDLHSEREKVARLEEEITRLTEHPSQYQPLCDATTAFDPAQRFPSDYTDLPARYEASKESP